MNLRDQLNDLYKLHIAAKELLHGIHQGQWMEFQPSKFVYAFFAFNSFYSFDWEESANNNKLIKWNIEKNKTKSETQMFSEMGRFIYNTYVKKTLNDQKNDIAKEEFPFVLSNKFLTYLNMDINDVLKSLDRITIGVNISEHRKKQFIKEFSSILNNENKGEGLIEALEATLRFVYNVRNNIFHGTKTVFEMMAEKQLTRLHIYTSILLSINEMLFEALEIRFNWSRKQIDIDLMNRKKEIACGR